MFPYKSLKLKHQHTDIITKKFKLSKTTLTYTNALGLTLTANDTNTYLKQKQKLIYKMLIE